VTVAVALVFGFLFQTTFKQFHPFVLSHSQHLLPHSIHLGWWSLILAMTLNAFYEEIAFMGYAFNQFAAKRGTTFALVVTVLLRMSFHSYQGPFHVLGIGAVFFLTSLAYCRTRNLWPLILAHIIVDVGMVGFVKIWYG
jgi:membrane protease YdiL (CAAX protease family)